MKVEHINPIVESVYTMCQTMLGVEVQRGTIVRARKNVHARDITAFVGISGSLRGVFALSFPVSTALAMVSRLLDTKVTVLDETVSDAIAELTNIVAGSAKARLGGDQSPPNQLSLPTVVRGGDYEVDYPKNSIWIEIPFAGELGPFSLRLTLQERTVATSAAADQKEMTQ